MRRKENQGLARRLAWFVLLWLAGVLIVATVAYLIRFIIGR